MFFVKITLERYLVAFTLPALGIYLLVALINIAVTQLGGADGRNGHHAFDCIVLADRTGIGRLTNTDYGFELMLALQTFEIVNRHS